MIFKPVPRERLPEEFGAMLKQIQAACRHGYDFPEYLLDKLHEELNWLFVLMEEDGQNVGCMILLHNGRAIHVRLLAVKSTGVWLPEVIEWLSGFARYLGLKWLSACGRKGWERRLAPFKVIREGEYLFMGV